MRIRISQKGYRALFVFWSLTVLILTSIPDMNVQEEKLINFDKLFHFSAYLILAFFFIKMQDGSQIAKNLKLLLILSVVIPIFDELHQIPIPGRFFSWGDVVADLLGFLSIYTYFRIKLKTTPANQL